MQQAAAALAKKKMLLLTPLANVGASESVARQASKQTNARVVYDERAAATATAAAVKRCKAGASLV